MTRRADDERPLEPLRAASRGDPVAALLDRTVDPEPLGPAELARVRARLRRGSAHPRRARGGQLASTLAALLTGVGVAFGGWGILQVAREPSPEAVTRSDPVAVTAAAPVRARQHSTPSPSSFASGEPVRTPAIPEPDPKHEQQRPRSRPAVVTPALSAEARGSNSESERGARNQLSLESEALARALVQLRRERNPRAALAALDDYAAEFPNGALRLEAQVARIDALLALGHKPAVLALLSNLPLDRVGRGAELRLMRAELTAERDCARARSDLDLLIETAPANVRERALRVRAACDRR